MSYKVIIGIPMICLLVIGSIVLYPLASTVISSLLQYGQLNNPCVNIERFEKSGRTMDELFFNEKFDCYSVKYPD